LPYEARIPVNEQATTLQRQAALLHREGRRPEAIDAYRRLLAMQPELTDCWYDLGFLLKAEGRFTEALEAYGEALARGVNAPEEVRLNRAVIYSDHLRRDEAAEQELRASLAIDPGYLPALLNLGNLQEERGQREEALASYERALEPTGEPADERREALRGEALARIAHLRPPANADDPLLERMKVAAANPSLDTITRANILFSLGRARDALGLHAKAFTAFTWANRLARQTGPEYSRTRARRTTEALIRSFPRATTAPAGDAPAPGGVEPLFICGMFRSGSTLVEQVLAGHSKVTPGGEIDFLPRLVRGALAPFPAAMESLDTQGLAGLAAEYRAHLASLFPQAIEGNAFITDKRPDNFLLIGLIKQLFPAAKIIHTARHPLDNGFSIFMQHLDQRLMSYASDLGDIGHYFGQYRRVMAHWKELYPDDILDFSYDAFVREPRPALERLLSFLGLEWDERCLEFHQRDNTVKTASYWQVRRPLYGEACGRWRNYAAYLGPLAAALRTAGVPDEELS
jgi:tetratricopeptide (TPR) repeat protein